MSNEIVISTPNRQIADELLALHIPEASQNEVEKYGELEQILFYVVVHFVSPIGVSILAKWLYDTIKKPGKEKIKIKDRPIPQNIVHIEKLIINQIQINKSNKTHDEENSKNI